MIKKSRNIINNIIPYTAIIAILIIWQILSYSGIVPRYMLPSPIDVVNAFIKDLPLLIGHAKTTLLEAFIGLSFGICLGFIIAALMDHYSGLYRALYPIIVITQTIPTVAIAPLLILWLGYGMAPKITLIIIVTFFPIAVGLLDGFKSADSDTTQLLKAMGANKRQIFYHIKLPNAMSHFYAGLRISVSYSIVGAVISEWLGGFQGLGVYMTRVKKSYSFDKMFAVIFMVTAISLLLMNGVTLIQKWSMPWTREKNKKEIQ